MITASLEAPPARAAPRTARLTDIVTDPAALAAALGLPPELIASARIAAELAACLPGYLVPCLVRELQGAPAKVALAPWPFSRGRSRGAAGRGC